MRAFAACLAYLLLCAALPARADDDPEPPGGVAQFRQVLGSWRSARLLAKGEAGERTTVTYTFERDRFSYDSGKISYQGTLKYQTKGSHLILELKRDNSSVAPRHIAVAFKKGQLHLSLIGLDVSKQIDFTGKSNPVLVMKREKK